jgi:hypothetical protein
MAWKIGTVLANSMFAYCNLIQYQTYLLRVRHLFRDADARGSGYARKVLYSAPNGWLGYAKRVTNYRPSRPVSHAHMMHWSNMLPPTPTRIRFSLSVYGCLVTVTAHTDQQYAHPNIRESDHRKNFSITASMMISFPHREHKECCERRSHHSCD